MLCDEVEPQVANRPVCPVARATASRPRLLAAAGERKLVGCQILPSEAGFLRRALMPILGSLLRLNLADFVHAVGHTSRQGAKIEGD